MKELHYFCEGFTSDGYTEFYWENFKEVEVLAIVDKLPQGTLSRMAKIIAEKYDYNLEIIHSALNHENVLAIKIDAKIVILEHETFEMISKQYFTKLSKNNQYVPSLVKLKTLLPCSPTPYETVEIDHLHNLFHAEIEESRKALDRGKEVHDRWESLYLREIDFEKVDKYIDECADKVCELIAREKQTKQFNEINRFLGAGTYTGSHDYIDSLTADCKKIYIQGYPGTAKSTLIKRTIERVKACNFAEQIEMYHCGFDPYSLDMVIFRNSKVAMFDCTAPHQYTPNENDMVFNVYEYATRCDVNKMFKEEISSTSKEYRRCINESTQHLKNAEMCTVKIDEILFQGIYSASVLAEKYVEIINNYI